MSKPSRRPNREKRPKKKRQRQFYDQLAADLTEYGHTAVVDLDGNVVRFWVCDGCGQVHGAEGL